MAGAYQNVIVGHEDIAVFVDRIGRQAGTIQLLAGRSADEMLVRPRFFGARCRFARRFPHVERQGDGKIGTHVV